MYLKILFIYLFLERQEGREKEERNNVRFPLDLAGDPGMCPDWKSNQRPFGSPASTQSTEPHQPGPNKYIFGHVICKEYIKHLIYCLTC